MQNSLGNTILATVISVIITLILTLVFNKLVTIPAAIKKQKEAHRQELEEMKAEQTRLKKQVNDLQAVVDELPAYRAQSLKLQGELRAADNSLLETCQAIQSSMQLMRTDIQTTLLTLQTGQADLVTGLERNTKNLQNGLDKNNKDLALLKKSKKDELRIKLINQYHLFTDPKLNPSLSWSEMEYHAFDQLVQDYEKLGGNDFVHETVLPAMATLEIIPMSQVAQLEEVMNARHSKYIE
jgi:seryl-tRNA synthetase